MRTLFTLIILLFTFSLAIENIPTLLLNFEEIKKNKQTPSTQNIQKLKTIYPIIYFNGLMGHSIEAKLENIQTPNFLCYKNYPFYQVWIDLKQLYFRWTTDCLSNVLASIYDYNQRRITNIKGVTTRIKDFGGVNGLKYLDSSNSFPYYVNALNHLEKLGYKPGYTFKSAGLDWRKGPNELLRDDDFKQIKMLIEETVQATGKKVHILTHSYGGPVASLFLSHYVDQYWKEIHIKSLIPYGSPYDGSVATLLQMIKTIGYPYPHVNEAFTHIARTLSSASWMIPQSPYWDDKVLIDTPTKKYFGRNKMEVLSDYDLKIATENHRNNQKYDKMAVPNVPINCFYSYNISTFTGFKINKNGSVNVLNVEDGDGTVPGRDLRICDGFSEKQDQKLHPVKVFKVANLIHSDVSSHLYTETLTEILRQYD
jgi:hypothetical protein